MVLTRFAKYAWAVLFYNLAVILWGAFVRATGSGAGCGAHWPLCNGEVIPRSVELETVIELTHRVTSSLAGLLVIVLLVWAFRAYPKGHPSRLGASLSMLFILTEGLVGAGLVLFGWVAEDASLGRAISMAVHLINTFLLLGALSLTVWWGMGGPRLTLRQSTLITGGLLLALGGVLVLGVSGALTALGDTLFPVSTFQEGLQQDFSPTAHFLIRLRLLHPSIAVAVSFYLLLFVWLASLPSTGPDARRIAQFLTLVIFVQMAAGLVNVALLAPVWMQLIHLLLADTVWITLVFLTAAVLSASPRTTTIPEAVPASALESQPKVH
jgi:heme A synthase